MTHSITKNWNIQTGAVFEFLSNNVVRKESPFERSKYLHYQLYHIFFHVISEIFESRLRKHPTENFRIYSTKRNIYKSTPNSTLIKFIQMQFQLIFYFCLSTTIRLKISQLFSKSITTFTSALIKYNTFSKLVNFLTNGIKFKIQQTIFIQIVYPGLLALRNRKNFKKCKKNKKKITHIHFLPYYMLKVEIYCALGKIYEQFTSTYA